MKKINFAVFIISCCLFIICSPAYTSDLERLEKRHAFLLESTEKYYLKQLERLNDKAIWKMEFQLQQLTSDGKLNEAIKLRDRIKALKQGRIKSPETEFLMSLLKKFKEPVYKKVLYFDEKSFLVPNRVQQVHIRFSEKTIEAVISKDFNGLIYEEGASNGISLLIKQNKVYATVSTHNKVSEIIESLPEDLPEWYHIAFQFDDGKTSLWINGKLIKKNKAPYKSITSHRDTAGIAGTKSRISSSSRTRHGNGAIAWLKISNKNLYRTNFDPPKALETNSKTLLWINPAECSIQGKLMTMDGVDFSFLVYGNPEIIDK